MPEPLSSPRCPKSTGASVRFEAQTRLGCGMRLTCSNEAENEHPTLSSEPRGNRSTVPCLGMPGTVREKFYPSVMCACLSGAARKEPLVLLGSNASNDEAICFDWGSLRL